jgi:hypothetical protein
MMNGKISEIIEHYKKVYLQYRNYRTPQRPDARNPEDRAMAAEYLRWCEENDVDEFVFMEELIRHIYQKRGIIVLFRYRNSEKALKAWHNGIGYRAMTERASQTAMATMDDRFTQLIRDLGRLLPAQEQYKRRHWVGGSLGVCSCSPECSGGYHPLSQYCPYCEHASMCIERLRSKWDFDVIALRAQRFDLLPEAVAKVAIAG